MLSSTGPRASSAATRVDEAAVRPSTNVTAPKQISLASHSVTLLNSPTRGAEQMEQPFTCPKLIQQRSSSKYAEVRVTTCA